MRCFPVTLCLLAILVCTTTATADRCSGISPVVFCDDFDRWCEVPPANPDDACPLGSPEDNDAFRAYWPQSDGICSVDTPYSLGTTDMWGPDGYAVDVPQRQDAKGLARHVHDMTPEIEANPLNTEGYGAVNGSGTILARSDPSYQDPSEIDGTLKGQFFALLSGLDATPELWCAYGNYIYYTELYLDDDRAPTNFTRINCYPEAQGPYQKLVATDGVVHASFAFGLMAAFDDVTGNPCDVDMGRKPSAWRAFVYDGLTWTRLKAPVFEIPMTSPADLADFRPWVDYNRFEFYVGSEHIEIRLYNLRAEMLYNGEGTCIHHPLVSRCYGGLKDDWGCTTDEDCPPGPPLIAQPYFVARVPRQYTGPFNKIAMGAGQGVDLTTPTCELVGPIPYEDECVGGINSATSEPGGDRHPCTTAADCPPSVGTCDTGGTDLCIGGLDHGTGGAGGATCATDADCQDKEECLEPLSWDEPDYNMKMEEVVLYDGVFEPSGTQGACCKPDTTCEVTEKEPCEDPEGLNGVWMGGGTVCTGEDAVTCCHTPWADADGDTDVDQVDFAIFQACFSGSEDYEAGCECFNRDGPTDTDIDGDDFLEFEECWSGPTVPWSATGNCPGTW